MSVERILQRLACEGLDPRTRANLERAAETMARLEREPTEAERQQDETRRRANRSAEIEARLAGPPAVAAAATGWSDCGNGWQELRAPSGPVSGRQVRGIASSCAVNSHGYSVDPMGMTCELPIPLRSGHALEGRGIGEVYLFRRNAKLVYFEAALVEDLAQETFLRVFRALPGFDRSGPARLSTCRSR